MAQVHPICNALRIATHITAHFSHASSNGKKLRDLQKTQQHQQKALLVCQMCFPDAQIVWMLALIASLNQGFSITAMLAG
jgi:hypothetical protein